MYLLATYPSVRENPYSLHSFQYRPSTGGIFLKIIRYRLSYYILSTLSLQIPYTYLNQKIQTTRLFHSHSAHKFRSSTLIDLAHKKKKKSSVKNPRFTTIGNESHLRAPGGEPMEKGDTWSMVWNRYRQSAINLSGPFRQNLRRILRYFKVP